MKEGNTKRNKMDARKIVSWFKDTNEGRFTVFAVIFSAVLLWYFLLNPKPEDPKLPPKTEAEEKAEKKSKNEKEFVEKNYTVPEAPASWFPRNDDKKEKQNEGTGEIVLPMSLAKSAPKKSVSENVIPFGRMIPCSLMNTVDTNRIETPIIGIVLEDVFDRFGNVAIPASTEVHSIAQQDRSRDRIASDKNWVLIFPDRKEMRIQGMALTRNKDPNGNHWALYDGSAGIKGSVEELDPNADLKLIIAAMLQGVGQGASRTESVVSGGALSIVGGGGVKDMLGKGVSNAAQIYTQKLTQDLQNNTFVRAVGGATYFYLYTLQAVDPEVRDDGLTITEETKK